jgi:hypothetical protein
MTVGRTPTAPPPMIDCAIFRVERGRLEAPDLAGTGDELVLLLGLSREVASTEASSEVVVEFWRGDRLRDSHRLSLGLLQAEGGRRLYRLRWGDTPTASVRLSVRLVIDRRELARAEVLLGRPLVDAQGRLVDAEGRQASPRTILSIERWFRRLLFSPDSGPGEKDR